MRLLPFLLLAAGCGDPALAVLGDWNVVGSTYTIQSLNFDMEVVDEQSWEATDLGTMSFVEGVPSTGFGEYTFTRALSLNIDRAGLTEAGERYVGADATPLVVGFDPMPTDDGDKPTIMIYDSAEPWNGEWTVSGGPAITHEIFTEYSPSQMQLEIIVFELRRG